MTEPETIAPLAARKRTALVAHDHKKAELLDWCRTHKAELSRHQLWGTGTTGRLVEEALGLPVTRLLSGPLGGDQQLGAMIAEARIDVLVFFWDPLQSLPHDPDVKALLRLAAVWNIPMASNRATADFLITSPLMTGDYPRELPDFTAYLSRPMPS